MKRGAGQGNRCLNRSGTIILLLIIIFSTVGCYFDPSIVLPDRYKPLSELETGDQAVVRIYATPCTPLGRLAIHTWLVVKAPHAHTFDRWEGWNWPTEPYGHLRKNLYGPEDDFGWGASFIITELAGPEAEPIVEFIETRYAEYPYNDTYDLLLGPNCNTYTQWVLDQTGWSFTLPSTAFGKDYQLPPSR